MGKKSLRFRAQHSSLRSRYPIRFPHGKTDAIASSWMRVSDLSAAGACLGCVQPETNTHHNADATHRKTELEYPADEGR